MSSLGDADRHVRLAVEVLRATGLQVRFSCYNPSSNLMEE